MAIVDQVREWLAGHESADADRAIGAALGNAEPGHFEKLVEVLLRRARPTSWGALIGMYERLGEGVRRALLANEQLMLDGATIAMKSGDARSRYNALAAIGDFPAANLAHLLALALREKSQATRERAAATLRRMAELYLTRGEIEQGSGTKARLTPEQQRRQIVDALRDALRTVDLHLRVEVLEPCVWFDADLAGDLEEALNKPRSRCIHVLEENLAVWDTPLLAPFLLRCLGRSDLRRQAQGILRDWSEQEEVTELLKCTGMLSQPEIRNGLAGVRSPHWFADRKADLRAVPVHLRPDAAKWVVAAGFTESEREAYLTRWSRSTDADLQQAAVWALAGVEGRMAETALLQIADSGGAMARVAHAALIEREARSAHSAITEYGGAGSSESSSAVRDADRDFATQWLRLRRTPAAELEGALEQFLARSESWGRHAARYLRSPDARDRLLAVRVVQHAGLAESHHEALRPLLEDPQDNIRRIVELVLKKSSNAPAAKPAPGPAPAARPSAPPTAAEPAVPIESQRERAGREAKELFERLMTMSRIDDAQFYGLLERLQRLIIELRREERMGRVLPRREVRADGRE